MPKSPVAQIKALPAADEHWLVVIRRMRLWITPPGAAIAMSIILRPVIPLRHVAQIALLGGLAVLDGIQR